LRSEFLQIIYHFFTPTSYRIIKVIKIIVKINVEVRLEVLTMMTVKIVFCDVRDIHLPLQWSG